MQLQVKSILAKDPKIEMEEMQLHVKSLFHPLEPCINMEAQVKESSMVQPAQVKESSMLQPAQVKESSMVQPAQVKESSMVQPAQVKESSMVQPAQDTPKRGFWLSNVDMMVCRHVLSIYFYRPNGSSNFFDASILKEALGKVLVPFYPVAGRLRLTGDKDGRLEINCNGEGVLFVEAETNLVIDDLGDFDPIQLNWLCPPAVDYSADISSYPLVLLQVTRFQCGGVALSMANHHVAMDGLSGLHFLKAWSELARGLDNLTILPLMDRTLLRARDPPTPAFDHIEFKPPPSLKTPQETTKPQSSPDCVRFKFTRDQLNILKAKAKSKEGDKTGNYSSFEVLTGHMWRCSCKARGLPDDQETTMFISVDGRSKLHPPTPPGYFGNVIFYAAPIAKSGDLINNPLTYATETIHAALMRMDDDYMRSAIDYMELHDPMAMGLGPHKALSPNIMTTSWVRLPTYIADFGWGLPAYTGPPGVNVEGVVVVLPSATNDGSLSLLISLQHEHMNVFKKILYEF